MGSFAYNDPQLVEFFLVNFGMNKVLIKKN